MAEFEFALQTDLAPIRDGVVVANFDEALAAVKQIVAPYQALAVTPETVREAANDRARLRKLRDRIDDQRKLVKQAYMAPVEAYAAAAKPILDEIDTAINNIDGQVKAFEEQERTEKLARIRAFFDTENEKASGLVEWDKIAARHTDWKNKGCSEDKAKSDILIEFAGIERDLRAMQSTAYETYRAAMIEEYCKNYSLADAINAYTQIKRREAMETERQKREEERRKQETEKARAEAEAKLMAAAQATGNGRADSPRYMDAATERENAAELTQALNREFTRPEPERTEAAQDAPTAAVSTAPRKEVVFRVVADSNQAKALGNFLRGNGIEYEIIRFRNEGAEAWTVPGKRG